MPRPENTRDALVALHQIGDDVLARELPTRSDQLRRFQSNPDACLSDLCRGVEWINGSIQDLMVTPDGRPAWIGKHHDLLVLMVDGKPWPLSFDTGVSPTSRTDAGIVSAELFGFTSVAPVGEPIVLLRHESRGAVIYIGNMPVWDGNLHNVGVRILPHTPAPTLVIWGLKDAEGGIAAHAEAFLWKPVALGQLGSWSSEILSCFGLSADELFVKFERHQGLGPKNASKPRGLHSLRFGREVPIDADVLDIVTARDGSMRILAQSRECVLGMYNFFVSDDGPQVRFIDDVRIPAPYRGGYKHIDRYPAYKVDLRHQQVAWVVGRNVVQPAMNQVTDLFEHPMHGWCYWGSVRQQLFLMKVDFDE